MQTPAQPTNEAGRLECLRSLDILDSQAEERFDRITRIAQHVFGVPIALVSLVDEDRQWFKSCLGLDARETPRAISFCGHSILGDEVMVVPDATRDPRFHDNPLVTGEPRIRFYAGVPLTSPEGHKLGTLCVISQEPRQVTPAECRFLEDLAGLVEQELFFKEQSQARRSAMEANRAKATFLTTMAHEIRTPLNAIIGSSELLIGEWLDGEQREFVETIHSGSESLLALVNDLLDMSKIEAGKLEVEVTEFCLRPLLSDSLRLVARAAAAKGLSLALAADPQLDLRVHGDSYRLRQVLLNLVQNAIKFTDVGGVQLRADVILRGERQLVARFEVVDTGIGIALDRLEHIFHAFRQADGSTTRRFGGTGLGLSISRELVELMGGELCAESDTAAGSRFWFELPFEISEAEDVAGTSEVTSLTDVAPRRLLLVDDHPLNRKIAAAQARRLGHEMETVASGEEALQLLAAGAQFDAVLMDLHLPGMSGLDTARAMRQGDGAVSRVPIIAMTASVLAEDRQACTDAGMNGFLAKPVRLQQLQASLDALSDQGERVS